MKSGVLLDSSYLITLVNSARPNHAIAKDYYRLMLKHNTPMFLSSIVVSEVAVKQSITDFPLNNFRPVPFNITHGKEAARIWNILRKQDEGDFRHVVRDDVKIMSQAAHESIPFLLTEDSSTLYKYCTRLNEQGQLNVKAIKLADGYKPGALGLSEQPSMID